MIYISLILYDGYTLTTKSTGYKTSLSDAKITVMQMAHKTENGQKRTLWKAVLWMY